VVVTEGGSKLILFDIDGTLLLSGGAGMRGMNRAFEELFEVSDAFEGIPMAGRTDAVILTDAVARLAKALPADATDRFRRRYFAVLQEELEHPALRKGVLPGVRTLLETLRDHQGVFLALLSGNFAEAARLKLEYFGLAGFFPCGAYGDDAADRNALVPVAVTRARACGAPDVPERDVVVVGDTPLDVACAHAAGARAIAVATGDFDVARLRASGADAVFEDLRDPAAFLLALRGGKEQS
jgi:phosphoglycolate phosphatase